MRNQFVTDLKYIKKDVELFNNPDFNSIEFKNMKVRSKPKSRILIAFLLICCVLKILFITTIIYCLSPSTEQYTEFYNFPIASRNGLIYEIIHFKESNPEYNRIRPDSYPITERTDSYVNKDYNVFFYFADINQSVHRIIQKNPTRIGLVHVSDKDRGAFWTQINSFYLSRKENKQIKEKFEKEILNKLGFTWKHENNHTGIKRFFSFLERYLLFKRRSYDLRLG